MSVRPDLPGGLENLLGSLSQIEEQSAKTPRKCASGDSITKELEDNTPEGWISEAFNVIPRGKPGRCHSTLLVAVGYNDDVEKRVLEAHHHVSKICPGVNKYVIFWAAKWYPLSWKRYSSSFKDLTVILKPFFAEPTILLT